MVSGNIPGDSNALKIQIPCIIFFAVSPFFVCVRLWTRVKSASGLGLDDYAIITSLVFAQIVSALMMGSCAYGFGQHIRNLSPHNKIMTLKLFYVAQVFYKLTINLTKASIVLLYLRIFVQRYFRILCYIMLAIIMSYLVAASAASIWQCTPIERAWNKAVPGTCISITKNWYANAGYSIATDFIILVLPMHPLYKSSLPRNQKLALMSVFAVGVFVAITSIFRMQTIDFSTTSPDTTYDVASTIWTIVEENVAIVCACLPMCRKPLTYLFPSLFSSMNSTAKGSTTGSRHAATGPAGRSRDMKTFQFAGSSRNDWVPEERRGIQLATVEAPNIGGGRRGGRGAGGSGSDDDTSEEYILEPSSRFSGSAGNVAHPYEAGLGAGGIHKVTQYEVRYEERN